jgi:hypothetical protein
MVKHNAGQDQQNSTTIPPEALARDPISLPNPVQVPKAPITRKIPLWIEVFIQILDAGKLNTAENPVTGLPYQTQEERDFVDQLSDRQRNSLAQTDVSQELGSVTNTRRVNSCTVGDLPRVTTPAHDVAVKAWTGAPLKTVVVAPTGQTSVFDGEFQTGLSNKQLDAKRAGTVWEIEAVKPSAQVTPIASSLFRKIPEWEYQSKVAKQCGLDFRVGITNEDAAEKFSQQLASKGIEVEHNFCL